MSATVTQLRLLLDKPDKTYLTGEFVTGKVLAEIQTAGNILGVLLNFSGHAHVDWHETRGSGKDRKREWNTASLNLIQFSIPLYGNGNQEVYIPAGQNSYNFQFQLGPGLPSSFRSIVGYVKYTITAEIARPGMLTLNNRASEDIRVIARVDLNQIPAAIQPVNCQVSEIIRTCCCCPSSSQPLTMSVKLPFSGYVPGMNLPVGIEIDNGSDRIVEYVSVRLGQRRLYRAQIRTEVSYIVIAEGKFCPQSIQPGNKENFVANLLLPPGVEPTGLGASINIIDVRYILTVTAHMPSFTSNPHIEVDILIGTIPLVGAVDGTKSVAAKSSLRNFVNL